ncbi:anaerobic ribonucleoside-triphosphate reductase activating protein [Demequina sp.]|uniref:anaerobic ribonucleoside-triphosphate reductase activating protein n=1 Tax=Demequina sp. TaxID=2050685 RepID=UPI003D0C2952
MPLAPDPALWLSSRVSQQYVADYKPFTFVDGEGVRCALYVSGCLFKCEGCFNVAAQSFRYGVPFTRALEDVIMRDLAHPAVQGLTLLGGEPFLSTEVCLSVVTRARAEFGSTKDVWAWSGYTFEQIVAEGGDKLALMELCDVLVDGPYLAGERDLTLRFRGSRNQRVLDVRASLAAASAMTWRPRPTAVVAR